MESEPQNIGRWWQEQPGEEASMSVTDIRARADAHAERTRGQNRLTYIVVTAAVAANLLEFALEMSVMERVGAGLTFLALVLVLLYYRHARGPVTMPEDLGLEQSVDFYRAQLVRQRDLVRRFWLWGALPFLPGIALSMLGDSQERPLTIGRGAALVTVLGLVVALIGWMNKREAERLRQEITGVDG